MESSTDVVVIGAGIVGLATAYRILQQRPQTRVTVVERANDVGTGQSSRNSGVLHAGLYYAPGSAKARWCRAGKAAFEAFADEHDIPVRRTGKVVVAIQRRELPGLRALVDRARINGVEIEELDAAGVAEHEPHVNAVAGAWTPETAVTDFGAACQVIRTVIEQRGADVHCGVSVRATDEHDSGVRVSTTAGDIEAAVVVACTGLSADRMARVSGLAVRERIIPFRGSWLQLSDDKAHLVNGNIYPVPQPGLPFLGVHLTRRIDGKVWIGPNAVLAGARHGHNPWSIDWNDLRDIVGFIGVWQLARKHLPTAVAELYRDRIIAANLREVRKYVPGIGADDIRRGPWGVRAQLVDRRGNLIDDFVVRESRRIVHVLNAPSPAATASFAIGEALRDRVLQRL
ncbi:MAG: L-2-hydroxyglutarate oxidase [Nitriliruptoraceae bacterium]